MGLTSLGIEYAEAGTKPCEVPDVLWRGFSATAALLDRLDALGRRLNGPLRLHVSWLPLPGQPSFSAHYTDPIRFNTVHHNPAGMFRPAQSDYAIYYTGPGYYLVTVQALLAHQASGEPTWQLQWRAPTRFGGTQAEPYDIAFDAGQIGVHGTADQWLSGSSVWQVSHGDLTDYLGRDGFDFATVGIRLAAGNADVLRVDLTVSWLRDL